MMKTYMIENPASEEKVEGKKVEPEVKIDLKSALGTTSEVIKRADFLACLNSSLKHKDLLMKLKQL